MRHETPPVLILDAKVNMELIEKVASKIVS